MTNAQPNLFTRPDTFFGVCQGLGEDLRVPPTLLRLGFAGALFFNPLAAALAYFAAGALVLLTRYFYPNPRSAEAQAASEAPLPLLQGAEAPEPERLAA